jgi:hypothetical protein
MYLKCEQIDGSDFVGIKGNKFRLNFVEQSFDFGLASLLLRLVRVGLQSIKVRLSGTCKYNKNIRIF